MGDLQPQEEDQPQEEADEEVQVQVRRRAARRGIQRTLARLNQEEGMMPATGWSNPLFTGQGLRKHLVELEALFLLGASRLGRVPQVGEHEYVVLDATKKVLALQSMSEPIRDRLLRAEQNATSDLRMEVQVGEADPAANPREMVGWAAATWPQCVIGLGRFYPDEIVPATVVAEASCLQQKWWSPYSEGVTSFYNGCLATWSQKPEEFTELTMLTQFVRGLSPHLNPVLCIPGTPQYLGDDHMGIRHRIEQDMDITTTAQAYAKAVALENFFKTKMAMCAPPVSSYSPPNQDYVPTKFRLASVAAVLSATMQVQSAQDVLAVQ